MWTGSLDNGRPDTYLLGSSEVMTGNPYVDTGWLKTGNQRSRDESYPLYALSTAITLPIPEPSSLILAALGLIGLAACGWRQKR